MEKFNKPFSLNLFKGSEKDIYSKISFSLDEYDFVVYRNICALLNNLVIKTIYLNYVHDFVRNVNPNLEMITKL